MKTKAPSYVWTIGPTKMNDKDIDNYYARVSKKTLTFMGSNICKP